MPYVETPKLVKLENSTFMCRKCNTNDTLSYQKWESSDGGHEDIHYTCGCGHSWWVEGMDY